MCHACTLLQFDREKVKQKTLEDLAVCVSSAVSIGFYIS